MMSNSCPHYDYGKSADKALGAYCTAKKKLVEPAQNNIERGRGMRTLYEIHDAMKKEAEEAVNIPGARRLTDRDYEEIFYNALQAYVDQIIKTK
jgi:hypothetical protein